MKASADDELAEAVEARDFAEEEVTRYNAELSDIKEQVQIIAYSIALFLTVATEISIARATHELENLSSESLWIDSQ